VSRPHPEPTGPSVPPATSGRLTPDRRHRPPDAHRCQSTSLPASAGTSAGCVRTGWPRRLHAPPAHLAGRRGDRGAVRFRRRPRVHASDTSPRLVAAPAAAARTATRHHHSSRVLLAFPERADPGRASGVADENPEGGGAPSRSAHRARATSIVRCANREGTSSPARVSRTSDSCARARRTTRAAASASPRASPDRTWTSSRSITVGTAPTVGRSCMYRAVSCCDAPGPRPASSPERRRATSACAVRSDSVSAGSAGRLPSSPALPPGRVADECSGSPPLLPTTRPPGAAGDRCTASPVRRAVAPQSRT